MKINYVFSNILIAIIIFTVLGISSYILFQYLNTIKTPHTQIQIENSKNSSILIKNELSNYSISINDSIILDITERYQKEMLASDKKITKPSKIINNSKLNEFSIDYTPNLIVPELNPEIERLYGYNLPSLSIKSFDKSFNSNSYLYEIGGEIFEENKIIEEEIINGFKTYKFYTPDFASGGVSTVFVINENHYLTISYSYEGAAINERNKGFIELYNEIVNSVKKINN